MYIQFLLSVTQTQDKATSNDWNRCIRTWNASVWNFEVGLELSVTTGRLFKQWIWNSYRALPSARAAHCYNVHHISVTSDESEIRSDAAPNAHTAITCLVDQNHFVVSALCIEHFGQAVILRVCNDSPHKFRHRRRNSNFQFTGIFSYISHNYFIPNIDYLSRMSS